MTINSHLPTKKFLTSWSGGKDSAFAFWLASQTAEPVGLINMMDEQGVRSRSHGLSQRVLQAQAMALGLPMRFGLAGWTNYEETWVTQTTELKSQTEATHVVFGDIDLEAHKAWEEKVCTRAELDAWLPLWQQSRLALLQQMLSIGLKAVIVSARADCADLLGRVIDQSVIDSLIARGVDACGENGEYHTCVIYLPNFKYELKLTLGEVLISPEGYSFLTVDITESS